MWRLRIMAEIGLCFSVWRRDSAEGIHFRVRFCARFYARFYARPYTRFPGIR
jgi:hypothetical protein